MSLKEDPNALSALECSSLSNAQKITYLFEMLKNADPVLSENVENQLVEIGKNQIGQVVKTLENPNMLVKKHAAMTLIRIGPDSIEPLLNEYSHRKELSWMTDFIIQEITGIK